MIDNVFVCDYSIINTEISGRIIYNMSIGYTQNSEKEARGAKYKICKNRIKRKKNEQKKFTQKKSIMKRIGK